MYMYPYGTAYYVWSGKARAGQARLGLAWPDQALRGQASQATPSLLWRSSFWLGLAR